MDIKEAASGSVEASSLPPVMGGWRPDDRGMETDEVKTLWSGGCLGGRSSAEDGQVVAFTETPKALVAGKPEAKTVTGMPEVVDAEIPEAPTT